jgi:anti-sigma regulatory factor (Ser/Thr protein kinase)
MCPHVADAERLGYTGTECVSVETFGGVVFELVKVTVSPRPDLISVINAGLKALCEIVCLSPENCSRLQLATEEVFLYAVKTLKTAELNAAITVRYNHVADGFQIIVEYPGPRGPLDKYLKPGRLHLLEVKTFEALGLCLAQNILDSLTTQHWPREGITSYCLALNAPAQ